MTGIIDGTEIRVRCPAIGRKDRDTFISGKSKQNATKTMAVTDGDGHVLFCSAASPGSCADITHARQSGMAKLLETRGCRLPGSRSADRRAGGDPAALQVQAERAGLVRGGPEPLRPLRYGSPGANEGPAHYGRVGEDLVRRVRWRRSGRPAARSVGPWVRRPCGTCRCPSAGCPAR
ncbi:transposase family protein [Streptomyces olivochromogenes]|nr:transposase family protein [Streptomyces olivochromogenes]